MDLATRIETNYAEITARFEQCLAAGKVETDPFLRGEKADRRRGLTLLARPSPETAQAVERLIVSLQPEIGAQYVHPITDLHTTVLSVIPGSDKYTSQSNIVDSCIEATEDALRATGFEFAIEYRGLIASSDALIIKGYPVGDTLQQLRAAVIRELTVRGIEQTLSRRYVMIAAHMTAVRFVTQPPSLPNLGRRLEEFAKRPLATTKVTQLELAENDWYMRSNAMTNKGNYKLKS